MSEESDFICMQCGWPTNRATAIETGPWLAVPGQGLFYAGREIPLTSTAFLVCHALMKFEGQFLTADMLLTRSGSKSADNPISHSRLAAFGNIHRYLKKEFAKAEVPNPIHHRYGFGYRWGATARVPQNIKKEQTIAT